MNWRGCNGPNRTIVDRIWLLNIQYIPFFIAFFGLIFLIFFNVYFIVFFNSKLNSLAQVCVWHWIKKKKLVFFYYSAFFYYYLWVSLHFLYYLWVSLYYFSYFLVYLQYFSAKSFQFQLHKLFPNGFSNMIKFHTF